MRSGGEVIVCVLFSTLTRQYLKVMGSCVYHPYILYIYIVYVLGVKWSVCEGIEIRETQEEKRREEKRRMQVDIESKLAVQLCKANMFRIATSSHRTRWTLTSTRFTNAGLTFGIIPNPSQKTDHVRTTQKTLKNSP